jgi:hypothetical protein
MALPLFALTVSTSKAPIPTKVTALGILSPSAITYFDGRHEPPSRLATSSPVPADLVSLHSSRRKVLAGRSVCRCAWAKLRSLPHAGPSSLYARSPATKATNQCAPYFFCNSSAQSLPSVAGGELHEGVVTAMKGRSVFSPVVGFHHAATYCPGCIRTVTLPPRGR